MYILFFFLPSPFIMYIVIMRLNISIRYTAHERGMEKKIVNLKFHDFSEFPRWRGGAC